MSGLTPPGGAFGEEPDSPPPPPPPPATLPSFASYAGSGVRGTVPVPTDKGLGWTGFGLAVIFCVPLLPLAGVVIAIIALARQHFRPRWVAVLAMAIGAAGTLLQVAMAPSVVEDLREGANESIEQETQEARDSGEPREVPTLKLRTGDCFNSTVLRELSGSEAVETETVTLLPCDRPHDLEVFKVIEMPGDDFPGQRAIDQRGARCVQAFETFVGKPYGSSRYEVYYNFPTPRSWRLLGDRKVSCLAGHPRKQVTGTLADRRR